MRKQGLYDPQFEHDSCGVGFVCDVKGRKSNQIINDGLAVLKRLSHRGAVGADPKTGDGAGILIQIPHDFFGKVCEESKINLPNFGDYGTGLVFLPRDKKERGFCQDVYSRVIRREGQTLLGWRKVPLNDSDIGVTGRETAPVIEQVFIGRSKAVKDQLAFERKLYAIRKRVENIIRGSKLRQKSFFYITNLSSRTFSYKGLLMPYQVEKFFLDLKDKDIASALCLVHSRYSTNTFPTWDLAQPFRFLAHNGEINTLRGNINWMEARFPGVIVPGGSDSATIDNVFEFLVLNGRSLPHAMMMLIPGAWEQNKSLDPKLRDFYKYHACFMEPWDGPAAIAFTDGNRIGAVLDRNGLRPARYLVTKKDLVVMASEVGVLDIPPQEIAYCGRLEPGKIFFIDTEEKRIVQDDEVKETISSRRPYGKWLKENLLEFDKVKVAAELALPAKKKAKQASQLQLFKAFGYTREDFKFLIQPMAETGKEPVGSMGNDTPHAVLSRRPQLLFDYFKQLFAQVTNPAIDPIREELVMSLDSFVGAQKNILEETPQHAHKIRMKNPILSDADLAKIRGIKEKGFRTKTISLLFPTLKCGELPKALDCVCREAEKAIKKGFIFIILSDRGVSRDLAALPSLLATGAVHHHLIRKTLRTRVGIILESGEPREVHHFALLFGYGADAVNPYLAYAAALKVGGDLHHYQKAVEKGILKILSKMGISTIQSYRGAQIFEALGLSQEVIDRAFSGTPSRVGGAGWEELEKEVILRQQEDDRLLLSSGGRYQWKRDGEFHLWNPDSIVALQDSARKGDYQKYLEFAALINDQSNQPTTLRSLLKFKKTKPIPLDEVEPAEEIFKRFATGAMSFGSISRGAHETLAKVMNKIGGRSNTGEGGEDPARFADERCSAVKQVASGRFGVTANYLTNADELQIKIAQGAKPGEGGQLPGHKVSAIIARTRYTTPGVTLISPPPHHDIYSIEDLAQLIFDLKNVNPRARISVKLVSEVGVGTIAAGVTKGHADMILISGGDGGTGASPLSSIKHAGLPWELGLSETHQTLVLNDLRSRVRLQTDGQMRTGRDVALAAILGAEEYGFCTAALIVLGCVMLRHCHLNNCSVGVATQDDILQERFAGKVNQVINYFTFVARELRGIMAELGVKTVNELIGRTDLLEVNDLIIPWKAKAIDFSKILWKPSRSNRDSVAGFQYCTTRQDHGIENVLDRKLIGLAKQDLDELGRVALRLQNPKPIKAEIEIKNSDRTTGAMLSGEICRRFGEEGLPPDTIHFKFKGTAGQSFGAWLAKGVTFELEGMANDYVGKGISGGKIVIYPDRRATYRPEENILIGNTTFYGAIAGEAYIRGLAGERFCIRNSGLHAVVEGVGDHGCEYMTGGKVVVLGKTGRNFAAGMSGGIAYVYDADGGFKDRCNLEMVELEAVSGEDAETIRRLLEKHFEYTGSPPAKKVLDNFNRELKHFVKVMPIEYKRILESKKIEERLGLLEVGDG